MWKEILGFIVCLVVLFIFEDGSEYKSAFIEIDLSNYKED
jgi:hypothetical protein